MTLLATTACTPDAAPGANAIPAVIPQRGFLQVPQVSASLFDFDDNVMFMRTSSIYVFHKGSGRELAVPTDVYAHVRGAIGYDASAPRVAAPGKRELTDSELETIDLHAVDPATLDWSSFYHRAGDDLRGSFRDFYDLADPERLEKDVAASMQRPDWQGPSWKAFVRACKRPETAQYAFIVTARGHAPETMHRVLETWQRQGLIAYVPPVENILTCSNRNVQARLGITGDPGSISRVKQLAIQAIVDEIQALPLGRNAVAVLAPDGTSRRPLHLIGFSDDDPGNEASVEQGLGDVLRARPGAYDKVKITTFGTGSHPNVEVIRRDGSRRPPLPGELEEANRLMGATRPASEPARSP